MGKVHISRFSKSIIYVLVKKKSSSFQSLDKQFIDIDFSPSHFVKIKHADGLKFKARVCAWLLRSSFSPVAEKTFKVCVS